MTSINSLYISRCAKVEGKYIPTFWVPEPVDYYTPCLFGDTTKLADTQEIAILRRIIGIGLGLEIEAGKLILEALHKELPAADAALPLLLKSNSADEGRHYKGFENAAKTYGSDTLGLDGIVQDWLQLASQTHPVYAAALLETCVFLVTLGLMRIAGSPSITRLALKVAEDEFRHVQTNVAVSQALGFWSYPEVVPRTLEWVFQGDRIRLPGDHILDITKGVQYSRELHSNLESRELDELTRYSTHNLPFELSNSFMYSNRELADEGYTFT